MMQCRMIFKNKNMPTTYSLCIFIEITNQVLSLKLINHTLSWSCESQVNILVETQNSSLYSAGWSGHKYTYITHRFNMYIYSYQIFFGYEWFETSFLCAFEMPRFCVSQPQCWSAETVNVYNLKHSKLISNHIFNLRVSHPKPSKVRFYSLWPSVHHHRHNKDTFKHKGTTEQGVEAMEL